MRIDERSTSPLESETKGVEVGNGEKDHVLEIEDEVALEVVVTKIIEEAGENWQISSEPQLLLI